MAKQRKRRFGAVMMAVGLILIITAIGYTAYNIWDEIRVQKVTGDVVDRLEDMIPEPMDNPIDNDTKTEEFELDGNKYIAILEIPQLSLKLPVMNEWSYPNLKISPCRFSGSIYTNDLVIAAHNYRAHFGGLRNLERGDKVYMTDANGNRFTYVVVETETVMPTEIEKMQTGDWDLTMFTCNYSGRARVAVRCTKQADE